MLQLSFNCYHMTRHHYWCCPPCRVHGTFISIIVWAIMGWTLRNGQPVSGALVLQEVLQILDERTCDVKWEPPAQALPPKHVLGLRETLQAGLVHLRVQWQVLPTGPLQRGRNMSMRCCRVQ